MVAGLPATVYNVNMKIKFENFAKAGNGTIEVNDLTVICGPNNTGKTFLNYGIFSILVSLKELFVYELSKRSLQNSVNELIEIGNSEIELSNFENNLKKSITKIEKKLVEKFHTFFSVPEDNFSDLAIGLDFKELEVREHSIPVKTEFDIYGGTISAFYFYNANDNKIILNYTKKENNDIKFENKNLKIKYYSDVIQDIVNEIIYGLIFSIKLPDPFPITSERTGIALFNKIFDYYKDRKLRRIDEKDKIVDYSMIDELKSSHALPLQYNMERIRFYENARKNKSFFCREEKQFQHILNLHSELIYGGTFQSENDALMFQPSDKKDMKIPIHVASSSLKAHVFMDLFIKNIASTKHMLFIDEPELNLHPENQVKMAKLITGLVNSGVKVMITTHSDFLLRELNNLITLNNVKKSNPNKKNVMERFGYKEDELLSHKRVNAYMTSENREIIELKVSETGLNSKTINSVIFEENKKSQAVFDLLEDDEND